MKTWFGKVKDVVLKPFRAGKDWMDRHPSAGDVREYALSVKAVEHEHRIYVEQPDADKKLSELIFKNGKSDNPDWRDGAITAYNACLNDFASLRRSQIHPALAAKKKALKLRKIEAKAVKKEEKVLQKDPPIGIQAIPPTLIHGRSQATKPAHDEIQGGGMVPAPA